MQVLVPYWFCDFTASILIKTVHLEFSGCFESGSVLENDAVTMRNFDLQRTMNLRPDAKITLCCLCDSVPLCSSDGDLEPAEGK